MSKIQKFSLLFLRLVLGWMYFYAGITKVLNPTWSAAGYLNSAKAFSSFYQFLASPDILPVINILNAWGLTLIGASLLLGVAVRLSASLAILLMLLYYLPLGFPKPSPTSYIVDQHVIYTAGLFILIAFHHKRHHSFLRRLFMRRSTPEA